MTAATCPACEQPMTWGGGCTAKTYNDFVDGVERQRVAYNPEYGGPEQICHDCGAARGRLHHPGCDMETCPRCGGQAISCDCPSTANHDEEAAT